ncbi:hypothetical protein BT93_H2252 [Corymbia citriodora subsp. variegata]|nr:hypothetical protein BT93_H2252 [Corymbia citriodora subsp. variegata]
MLAKVMLLRRVAVPCEAFGLSCYLFMPLTCLLICRRDWDRMFQKVGKRRQFKYIGKLLHEIKPVSSWMLQLRPQRVVTTAGCELYLYRGLGWRR